MVKEVNDFQLSKSVKHKYSLRVRFHPSAKTSCINDDVKPIIQNQETDHILLHTETNDLSSDKTSVQICNDIINLAAPIEDKDIKVTISEIAERNDAINEKNCIGKGISVKNKQNYWTTNNQISQYQTFGDT